MLESVSLLLLLLAVSEVTGCAPHDDPGDCAGLLAFARATNVTKWKKSTHWGSDKTVCEWYGVKCNKAGRVSSLSLKDNGLKGSIPPQVEGLTELETFNLEGSRPADYKGCTGNDFGRTSLPASFFGLDKLSNVDLEYSCLGGELDGFSNLTAITSLQLHGNFISGSIPAQFEALQQVEILKLGRNPISGTLPVLKLPKAIQFNCNFCALSGSFPDMFAGLPSLQITYWDGNGFTGRLPPSLSVAAKLTRLSFNVNQFEGDIPPGICNIPAGDGPDTPDVAHDCRIGSDTSLEAYSANYPWIIKGHGNLYNCATIPECARVGSCNKTNGVKIVNPLSPVLCK